jgi:hypothetical protein
MLPNDFVGLVLQSQLFGNPASIPVVDFEAASSRLFSTQFKRNIHRG